MNTGIGKLARALAVVALLAAAGSALAQWELDGASSSVNFISIKNGSIAETHSFTSLLGYVGTDGSAQLSVNLASVETLIEIRNERMREMLFETDSFPAASATASVAPEILAAVSGGASVNTDLALTLSLHGMEKQLSVPVVLAGGAAGSIQLFTPSPVIINAADFGLAAGVAALQAVAGLQGIATAVPVTVHLVFTPAQ